ncbi:MAG: LacI family DNA-binding transcriptional regulator, partial [Anaerolineales bacterium]
LISKVEGFLEDHGRLAADKLLDLEEPPDAILAACDTLAIGALEAIQARGMSVPEDIALAGYNDIPAASLVTPGLTTAAVPAARMGELAMEMLQGLMEGSEPSQDKVIIPAKLIIRSSCGCSSSY